MESSALFFSSSRRVRKLKLSPIYLMIDWLLTPLTLSLYGTSLPAFEKPLQVATMHYLAFGELLSLNEMLY